MAWLWAPFAFIVGALPLSLWLGQIALGVDIRTVGDGNPGATNVGRAGGTKWFIVAMMLDILKGVLVVGVGQFFFDLSGPPLIATAIAPSLGHAFSPFLGFKGGKALATSLGAWIGLTLNEIPLMAVVFMLIWYFIVGNDGWTVMTVLASLGVYIWLVRPEPEYLWLVFLQLLLIGYTHRVDLSERPTWRPTIRKALQR